LRAPPVPIQYRRESHPTPLAAIPPVRGSPLSFPILVLGVVLLLIALRGVRGLRLPIWLVMLGGAVAVLLAGSISLQRAVQAVDIDVMLFLFGVFVVGRALEHSGYLYHLAYGIFGRARTAPALILLVLFGMGLASALLMNDTLAIVGTPLVLALAREHRMAPKALLFALAYAVTIGSVMSPIGNPQNLLIAVQGGMTAPFADFFRHLALPTLVNLGVAFAVLRVAFHDSFHRQKLVHTRVAVRDPVLARLARFSLVLLVGMALVKAGLGIAGLGAGFALVWIALAAAAPILLFSPRRGEILRHVDWPTLIFFAAMFVLMAAVWDSGVFQDLVQTGGVPAGPGAVFSAGVLLSQLVSNVPLVALLLPPLVQAGAGTPILLALAAGSTIAGNLLILGAASNVIIIQSAERRGGPTLGFFEFARLGVPLTAANALVYWLFLTYL
jgi:Na+/H+ antiporter NhaD/arsenite permease-like protein